MTAEERAGELMGVKGKDLPPLALAYRNHLCTKYGGCMEVCVTAFAHYAQCVEGLPTGEDPAYWANGEAKAWFNTHSPEA